MGSKRKPLIYPKMYVNLLRDLFEKNPNPSAEDRRELANMSELTFQQISSWFYRQRNLQQETKSSSTSKCSRSLAQRRREDRPKYHYKLEDRTKSLSRIKQDIKNVKDKGILQFPAILEAWDLKAKRLFILATDSRFLQKRGMIKREATKLMDIIQRLNILSPEQKQQVDLWEQKFRAEVITSRKTAPQMEEVITSTIVPWVTPYIYSKLTKQYGKYLVLESGIKEFARVAKIHTTVNWGVPNLVNSPAIFPKDGKTSKTK